MSRRYRTEGVVVNTRNNRSVPATIHLYEETGDRWYAKAAMRSDQFQPSGIGIKDGCTVLTTPFPDASAFVKRYEVHPRDGMVIATLTGISSPPWHLRSPDNTKTKWTWT